MPIRTPRGRAAAYRSLWQWPLRSPARLALTAAVVVGLAAVVGVGAAAAAGGGSAGGTSGGAPSPAPTVPTRSDPFGGPTTTPSTSAVTPTVLPPVPELRPSTLPVADAPPEALRVAGTWTAAWVRPAAGVTPRQWLDGLRPTTTDEYLGVLAGVDPSNIPSTRVTGAPRAVQVAARSVRVQVPTDALTLVVTVVVTDSGAWRVSGYDRV